MPSAFIAPNSASNVIHITACTMNSPPSMLLPSIMANRYPTRACKSLCTLIRGTNQQPGPQEMNDAMVRIGAKRGKEGGPSAWPGHEVAMHSA
jgi:hypothetical protein